MTGANTNGRPGVVRRFLTIALGLGLIMWLIACGGGSTVTPRSGAPQAPAQPDLKLSLATTPSADSITVTLRADDAAELYQLSCRVTFDPAVVTPLSASRGDLVDQRAAFFTTIEADNYVPVAFTYHPNESIPAAAGAIAVLEFSVSDQTGQPGFGLITNEDFLIANDNTGRRLTAAVEVAE